VSDYNEFVVSGVLKSVEKKELPGGRNTAFFEGVILSTYSPENRMPKTYEFTVAAFGDLGKRLGSMRRGEKILVKGRMENYSGISKQTGKPYVAFYKIAAKDISYFEDTAAAQKPTSQWQQSDGTGPVIGPDELPSLDDIPF